MKKAKRKILILIPIIVIATILVYTWSIILFTDTSATWMHYTGLSLFTILICVFGKDLKKSIIATGTFLILGTCNLFTLTPSITTNSYGIKIGSVEIWTPAFQLLSFGLLVFYCILNFDNLVDIYLDYKETREQKKKQ